jgi:dihydrofolate synthase/folylpolyglutamate synthase
MESYRTLLEDLQRRQSVGVRPGLGPILETLDRLGSPQQRCGEIVHIGGTNGKGSTAAMVESMVRAGGARTGLFTSPHLTRFVERIQLDGAPIDPAQLGRLWSRCKSACHELTFFECATVLALLALAEAGVDVTVLEVGLGGRLDATNVVQRPRCAVVTSIGLDHMAWLGTTLQAIAREKAGIFKPGCAAIAAAQDPAALATLEYIALERGVSSLQRLGHELHPFVSTDEASRCLRLSGAHQRANAALAWAAVEWLPSQVRPNAACRLRGLASVSWPGRMERIGLPSVDGSGPAASPRLLLDVAHNGEAAVALAGALDDDEGEGIGRRHLVVGLLADKDPVGILEPLLYGPGGQPRFQRVVCTQPPSVRALPAQRLAPVVASLLRDPPTGPRSEIDVEADPLHAVRLARAGLAGEDELVVCGSVYLVGHVRAWALDQPTDPVVVGDPGAPLGPS